MTVRRRTDAERQRARAALQRAAGTRWLVWSAFDGDRTLVGAHGCPNEARAEAKRLFKSTGVRHFVRTAA